MASITVENKDVVHIRMDDGKANAMNGDFLRELEGAFEEARTHSSPVLLEGRPGFFSGGLDIKTLPSLPADELRAALLTFGEVMLQIFAFPRPVVAACTGHAIAGGCVLALACDEVWAADGKFKIGLNETALGITLPQFVIEMAKMRVDPRSIHRVVAEGHLFDPAEARELGLVQHVVGPDEVIHLAAHRARDLLALPDAYGTNKAGLRRDALHSGRATFEEEIEKFADLVRGAGQ